MKMRVHNPAPKKAARKKTVKKKVVPKGHGKELLSLKEHQYLMLLAEYICAVGVGKAEITITKKDVLMLSKIYEKISKEIK